MSKSTSDQPIIIGSSNDIPDYAQNLRDAIAYLEQTGRAFLDAVQKISQRTVQQQVNCSSGFIAIIQRTANIRLGPSVNDERIGQMLIGTEICIIGETSVTDNDGAIWTWYQVEFFNENEDLNVGWIREDLLQIVDLALRQSYEQLKAELDSYGVLLTINSPSGRRSPQENQQDVDAMRDALSIIHQLLPYGVRFAGSEWTISEMQIIRDVIWEHIFELTTMARSMGYNYLDSTAIYRELFGYKDGTFSIVRIATDEVILGDNSRAWAENTGYGILNLGNYVFTRTGKTFDVFTLIGHELAHTINWKDFHRGKTDSVRFDTSSTPIGYNIMINNQAVELDHYYMISMRSETRVLVNDYSVNHTEQSYQSITIVSSGTVVELGQDEGFDATRAFARRSSDQSAPEFLTDALNARLMDLYTIGPQYNLEINKKGLARKEQGDELWTAILEYMLGSTNTRLP